MSCVGFEVYKFSEPPLLAQKFFQSPPLRVSKNFRSPPLNIFIPPPPPLVIINELSLIIISWRQFHAANCLNLVNFVSQFGQKEKRYGQIEDTSETKRTATLTNISNDASSNEQTLTKESLPDAIFLCLKVCNLSGRIVSLFKRTKFVTKRLKTDST